jgi:hypothetical protein
MVKVTLTVILDHMATLRQKAADSPQNALSGLRLVWGDARGDELGSELVTLIRQSGLVIGLPDRDQRLPDDAVATRSDRAVAVDGHPNRFGSHPLIAPTDDRGHQTIVHRLCWFSPVILQIDN